MYLSVGGNGCPHCSLQLLVAPVTATPRTLCNHSNDLFLSRFSQLPAPLLRQQTSTLTALVKETAPHSSRTSSAVIKHDHAELNEYYKNTINATVIDTKERWVSEELAIHLMTEKYISNSKRW